MSPKPDLLCQFSDRLFFTTFPRPAPSPAVLNKSPSDSSPLPKIRAQQRSAASSSQESLPPKYYWFTIDDQLLYLSFFQDWGPLNLAMVYKACILIHELLEDKELASYRLVLYSSEDPRRKANAALLMALYVMIVQRRAPWEAFHPIAEVEFMPFRDAGRGPSDFNLNIQDCLWGVWKAMQNGLCDMNEFNVDDYEFYEKVENGDWNWLTPNFIAFASPVDPTWIQNQREQQEERSMDPPSSRSSLSSSTSSKHALQRKLPTPFLNCLDYFEKKNVRLVVRLNTELYDRETFLDRGIDHMELYFDDGTNPTDEIVRTFIDISDKVIEEGGVVAVHCKAGLGRTGTLIGAYLIWKYGFTANEAIAFMRIVRPGSVVGPQQQYMYLKQLEWIKWAAADELKRLHPQPVAPQAPLLVQVDSNARLSTPPPVVTDDEVMDVDPETPTAARFNRAAMPPVTPSRHVAAAQAKAIAIEPPGQPRKTPNAKRSISARDDDSDEENDEIDDVLPPLKLNPTRPTKPRTRGRDGSATDPPRTRAAAAAASRKAAAAASPVKGQAPNKIPRLASTRTARAAAAVVPKSPAKQRTTTRARANPPPAPTPSRLPTLAAKKHNPTLSEVANSTVPASKSKKAPSTNEEKDKWMTANPKAVVSVPASKVASSDRPGLRRVRRRRSSFSNADVVA